MEMQKFVLGVFELAPNKKSHGISQLVKGYGLYFIHFSSPVKAEGLFYSRFSSHVKVKGFYYNNISFAITRRLLKEVNVVMILMLGICNFVIYCVKPFNLFSPINGYVIFLLYHFSCF